jgi:hypothetical protein
MRTIVAIACLALLCFSFVPSCKKADSGKTFDDYNAAVRKGIKKHIDEKDAKNKLLALHAKSVMQQIDAALIYAAIGVQVRNKPDLTREEAEHLVVETAEKRLHVLEELTATRREMRELVTAEQWNEIFLSPAKSAKEEKE